METQHQYFVSHWYIKPSLYAIPRLHTLWLQRSIPEYSMPIIAQRFQQRRCCKNKTIFISASVHRDVIIHCERLDQYNAPVTETWVTEHSLPHFVPTLQLRKHRFVLFMINWTHLKVIRCCITAASCIDFHVSFHENQSKGFSQFQNLIFIVRLKFLGGLWLSLAWLLLGWSHILFALSEN